MTSYKTGMALSQLTVELLHPHEGCHGLIIETPLSEEAGFNFSSAGPLKIIKGEVV